MKIENIKLEHLGRTSDIVFYRPDGEGKFPLVILSHGFNGHKSDFEITAKYYAANGTAAICHTFCGGSTRDKSGFPTTSMTLFTEKEDLLAILEEAKTWDCIDTDNIFLFGGSMGGMVSAMAAEEKLEDIKGLILLYPALCIADNWRENFKTIEEIPKVQDLWGMNLGYDFFISIRDYYVKKELGKYEGPVLIMHGTEDEVVTISYGEWAAKHYKNARLEVFNEEKHGFTEDGNRRMEAMMLYFIHDCMK